MNKFDAAKILLPNGQVAYDCVALSKIPLEGISLADYRNHVITVHTQNTTYKFVTCDGQIFGRAYKADGSTPKWLAEETLVRINGSTWGGSMIKLGFIGVDMHLEFMVSGDPQPVTTSPIASVQVAEVRRQAA